MTKEKINFNLSGIPRTLIFPLLGRALASQQLDSPFKDLHAVKLIQSLNYDFDVLLKQIESPSSLLWAGERALCFDRAIKHYLTSHPHAVVVNLGAGLETAFYRIDNAKLTWIDLDVPEVIAIRQSLLPPPDRVHYIAKSIFDYTWIDNIKSFGNDIILFAAGLFSYFTIDQIKPLFIEMVERLINAELLFDSIAKQDITEANNMLKKFNISDVALHWGIEEGQIESWSPHIKILSHTSYTDLFKIEQNKPRHFDTYMTRVVFV